MLCLVTDTIKNGVHIFFSEPPADGLIPTDVLFSGSGPLRDYPDIKIMGKMQSGVKFIVKTYGFRIK